MVLIGVGVLGFIPSVAMNIRISKQIVTECLFIGLVSFFYTKNLKWFVGYCVLRHIISLVGMRNAPIGVQIEAHKWSYIQLNTIFIYALAYSSMRRLITRNNVSIVMNGLCVIGLIQAFFVVLQYFGVWILIHPKSEVMYKHYYLWGQVLIADMRTYAGVMKDAYVGLTSNVNMGSSIFAITFPFFLRRKWILYAPFIVIGALISFSLGGKIPIALSLGLFVFFKFKKYRWPLVGLIIVGLLGLLYVTHDFSGLITGSQRFEVWRNAFLTAIPKKPWIGWGLGQSKFVFPGIMRSAGLTGVAFKQMHNELIQLIIETGYIGLVIVMIYLIQLIKKIRIESTVGFLFFLSFVSIIFNANVNFLFHTTMCVLALVVFATIEALHKESKWQV